MIMSGAASLIAKDPPQVANKMSGAVRLLNLDDLNDSAVLLVSIIGVQLCCKNQKNAAKNQKIQ
jgi:hypothetical protein